MSEAAAWNRCTRSRLGLPVIAAALLLASISSRAQTQDSQIPLHGQTEESLQEVARQVRNPISTLCR